MERPTFYNDLASVYGWMAVERIDGLIPDAEWKPIYLFGLFKLNGRSSWVFSDERGERMREIERRAARYGLPPVQWPANLPSNLVGLGRAATVARREGRVREFSLAATRTIWVHGRDPSEPDELRRIAADAGLDPDMLLSRMTDQDVKDELRATTDEAYARGVPGVPTVVVGDRVFWGDDRLEEAAQHAGSLD